MAINLGYIENACNDGEVRIRVYYDASAPLGEQPLIDGPRGWCLDITNLTGRVARMTVTSPAGTVDIAVAKGDPVTTGPGSGRSRTASQMRSLGFTTRGDVSDLTLLC